MIVIKVDGLILCPSEGRPSSQDPSKVSGNVTGYAYEIRSQCGASGVNARSPVTINVITQELLFFLKKKVSLSPPGGCEKNYTVAKSIFYKQKTNRII